MTAPPMPTLRLEAAGLEPLAIPSSLFGIRTLDPGHPVPRPNVRNAPGRDGTIDRTSAFGGRNLTAQLIRKDRTGTGWEQSQLLRTYLRPDQRSMAYLSNLPEYPSEVCATVRGTTLATLLTVADLTAGVTRPTVQWAIPSGLLESVKVQSETAPVAGLGSTGGFSYPIVYPLTYAPAPITGTTVVENLGGAKAWPVLRMRGPVTDPVAECLDAVPDDPIDPSRSLSFPGLVIAAGDFVEIDTRARTVRYNAEPLDSRRSFLAAPPQWWALKPGKSTVRYLSSGAGVTPATQLDILWRHAYL